MSVKVVNMYKEPYDIYIGRARKNEPYNLWCNPFKIDESKGETRDIVIERFRLYLWEQIKTNSITIKDLKELEGKTLGCFCKPKTCHGDIIARAVEWALKQDDDSEKEIRNIQDKTQDFNG